MELSQAGQTMQNRKDIGLDLVHLSQAPLKSADLWTPRIARTAPVAIQSVELCVDAYNSPCAAVFALWYAAVYCSASDC